jgi:hypothetical protein
MKQNTTFRPYPGELPETTFDLFEDETAKKVVLEAIRRYLDIDLSGATITGMLGGPTQWLGISVSIDGAVERSYYVECIEQGVVTVNLPSGSQIGPDPFHEVAEAWMQRLGFPAGYPRSCEVEIKQTGCIQLEICPCF